MTPADRQPGAVPSGTRLLMPLILLAVFTVPLSVSGTAVSLGDIADDLGRSPTGEQWVLNGYNLAFACSTLVWGSVADLVGRWRALTIGLLTFGAGSGISTVATDYLTLDGARLVAGAGAGAVFSVGTAVVSSSFEGDRRTRAFALLGSVAGLSLAFGPSLCGLLTEAAGWQLVYGFQLACLVVACAGMPLIRTAVTHERGRAAPFDVAGAALFCAATSLVLGGLALGSARGWLSLPFPLCMAAGIACYGLFGWRESTAPRPLLSLGTLRNRRFLGLTLVIAVASFTFTNAVAYLPVFFQGAYASSSGASGVFLMFMTVPVLVAPLIAGRLVARGTSVDTILAWSVALLVVGLVATGATAEQGLAWTTLPMALLGAGFGLQAGLIDGEALAQVPEEEAGMGAGWVNTVRLGSEAVAVSLFGALFAGFAGSAAHASRHGFAVITIGSALFAAAIGVLALSLVRRGRRDAPAGGWS
ncbi:MFS transporter [Actinacidiphila paucisporea]|uniref:Major Facilitator Superfamily protein n=1 Tax=Actinacidiphila paucisporea TaxID=310782 RepID=A0A1M7LT99_9ACTN|nr:MFS transporter [Actinacidiphila paucisporea]SHM81304.1 Major Facilitator Superfamily protein [Actinacidiphila paucisporea]